MNYKHSGSLGDIIYSLASIKSLQQIRCDRFSKANLYLQPDIPDTIPAWAGTRPKVRMSREQAVKLLPLLASQAGIGEAAIYTDQPIDIDLDEFRKQALPFDRGDLARYYAWTWRCKPALYERWLQVVPSERFKGSILVNRTTRYRNPKINYRFLTGRPDVVFVGYPEEYREFITECPRVPLATAKDALELASWIAGCKLFVGNQSFCFSLAQAMKTPRVLEVYLQSMNVLVQGPKGWDAVGQTLFEEIVREESK